MRRITALLFTLVSTASLVACVLLTVGSGWCRPALGRFAGGINRPGGGEFDFFLRLAALTVPYWLLVVVSTVLPAAWLILWTMELAERRDHGPTGLCRRCGYNLEGNLSGVCPECGNTVNSRP